MAEPFSWLEVSITCSGELAEALAEAINRYVENGVVIESITDYDPQDHENKTTGMVRVIGYLLNDAELEQKRLNLEETLWHYHQIMPVPSPVYRVIIDQNWMDAWKVNFKPLQVGKKWLILPAWMEAKEAETRTIIRIDPGMAFGTGTHPSTQLCLKAMEEHQVPGQVMIDLGCGSGILAIAALKAGSTFALAVDTDEEAVKASYYNAKLNGITQDFEVQHGSLDDILHGDYSKRQAPLVVANILAPIIIRLLKEGLSRIVAPGGKLILAGILENQAEEVFTAVKTAGLSHISSYQQDDWIALVVG